MVIDSLKHKVKIAESIFTDDVWGSKDFGDVGDFDCHSWNWECVTT